MAEPKIIDAQPGSIFFRLLPTELRLEIYRLVFHKANVLSARAAAQWQRGKPPTRRSSTRKPNPPAIPTQNALALLRVCQRARLEIGDIWLRQAHFWFGSFMEVVHKLAGRPLVVPQIRHMTVLDVDIMIDYYMEYARRRPNGHPCTFKVFWRLLGRLPGLQLDRLTIVEGYNYAYCASEIKSILSTCTGWKELHYVSPTPKACWPGSRYWRSRLEGESRPSELQSVIDGRDGASTKPSVDMYQFFKVLPERGQASTRTAAEDQDADGIWLTWYVFSHSLLDHFRAAHLNRCRGKQAKHKHNPIDSNWEMSYLFFL